MRGTLQHPHISVTVKDVAKAAGVHFSTVSLALNENPRIPEQTRDRIRQAAKRLGYVKNPVMQALASRKNPATVKAIPTSLVFLTNRRDLEELNQAEHMKAFVAGARERARELGYAFRLVFCGRADVTRETLAATLGAPEETAIIAGALVTHRRPCPHDLIEYQVVRIDTAYAFPGTYQVSNDQFQIVADCCRNLAHRGYRRPGLCVGRIDEENTHDAFASAYLFACERLGMAPLPPFHFEGSESCLDAAPRLRLWLRQHKPDVVLNNWGSVVKFSQAAKVSVPRDLAIVDLCLPERHARVSGMVQNHHLVGRRAAEAAASLLSARRQGNKPLVLSVRVPVYWNEGATAPRKSTP